MGEGTIENKVYKIKENERKNVMKIAIVWLSIVVSIYMLVLLINILKKPTSTFVVEKGKIYQEEYAEGYIIRSENLVNISDSKNGIVAIKSEGDKVGKGESIYRYCIDNEDEINKSIAEVDKEIQENLDDSEEFYSVDIKLINSQIDSKLDNLYQNDDLKKINQDKSDLNTYLTKKIKIRAEESDDEKLKLLLAKREELESQLKNKSTYIQAENSGVISYRIDGLEGYLKSDDFSYLSEDYLNSLDLETGEIIASSQDARKDY